MADPTRPLSLRLSSHAIEQLKARAYIVSGTPSGIARDLILTGLAGGDNKQLADRLMVIERQLAALQRSQSASEATIDTTSDAIGNLVSMFEALLTALTEGEIK